MELDWNYVDNLIKRALAEDLGAGDITTDAIFPRPFERKAAIVARQEGVIAGARIAARVFSTLDPALEIEIEIQDGSDCALRETVLSLHGDGRSILKGERTALNFLGWLSGIATLTGRFVRLVRGTGAKILDTRKTHPGMRLLEKYAVKAGGGENHRIGLYDRYLIKDNHLLGAGSIGDAVDRCYQHRAKNPLRPVIEVEVEDLEGLAAAIDHKADVILLDNMSTDLMRKAVEVCAGRARLEASGGITEESVRRVAECGVDYISIGALTHSAPSLDFSMEF